MKTKLTSTLIALIIVLFTLITPAFVVYSNEGTGNNNSNLHPVKSVLEHYNNSEFVYQTTQVSTTEDNTYNRITIVKTEGKYPLVRVEDTIRETSITGAAVQSLVNSKAMVADHVIVKLKDGVNEGQFNSIIEGLGINIRYELKTTDNSYLVSFNNYKNSKEIYKIINKLNSEDIVEFSEPDYMAFTSEIPNDPDFPSLWGLNNTGQTSGSTDSDIDAPEAWSIAKGSHDVVVAVIDTGIDYTHPDLKDNMWRNPGEIPDNGIDDDNNGFIDDVYGWDFYNDDNDPMDDNGHGTHCAGTIGAVGGNSTGVVGVNWNVSMAAIKFLDRSGGGSLSDAVESINYAVIMGIPITSNSWSGRNDSKLVEEAFANADSHSILSVAASGNNASNIDEYPVYPAAYTFPSILTVASTDHTDNLSWFSNYGKTGVDLAAPGEEIYSTAPNNGYIHLSGTSMATPHVAGAAALIKSLNMNLSNLEIKNIIMDSADPVDLLSDVTVSGGRLNIYNAVKSQMSPTPTPTLTPTPVVDNISVSMYNSNKQDASNSIYSYFKIANTGSSAINLSVVKIRYYYTIDSEKEQTFWCDWSSSGSTNVTGQFVKMNPSALDADYYLEVGFTNNAGYIRPGDSVEVHTRIAKTDWSNYNQTNDFSFNPTAVYYDEWNKIGVFVSDIRVWGLEPQSNGTTSTPTVMPTTTPSPTVSATITPTITPTPTAPDGSLTVKMYNSNVNSISGAIYPSFLATNTGSTALNLQDIKLRYYYTIDGEMEQSFWCDWASTGSNNVTGRFVKLYSPQVNADYYFELGFTENAGNLSPGDSVAVSVRFSKTDWSNYNQTNDFSFNPTASYYSMWDKVTAYVEGILVWGAEPGN